MAKINTKDLAGLEYHGTDGITAHCLEAIARLIHFGEKINEAQLLSCSGTHAFILTLEYEIKIVIQAGFGSGYSGEGSRGLSTALKLLEKHKVEIEEYDISEEMMERLQAGCLLYSDVDGLKSARPVRPLRYFDYICERQQNEHLDYFFPPSINYGLIDERIMDVALVFDDNPGYAIDTAYKRLEDTIRKRTGQAGESGSKLLTKALVGDASILYWDDENSNEHNSKANLFKAVFGAYRNPRAHREIDSSRKEDLREFMLINELYHLESKALKRSLEEV